MYLRSILHETKINLSKEHLCAVGCQGLSIVSSLTPASGEVMQPLEHARQARCITFKLFDPQIFMISSTGCSEFNQLLPYQNLKSQFCPNKSNFKGVES